MTETLDLENHEQRGLFEMALAFSKSIKAGEVKVKQEGEETSSSGSSGSSKSHDTDDDIPF